MSLSGESARGMAWTAAGKIAVRGLQFAIGIVLARLLTPADFGLVGVVAAFIAVSETFVDCGFSLALMRKLDRTDEDASTVFWFSLAAAAACYLVLFAAAPAIAAWTWPVLCALILPLWGMQPGWGVLALGALIALVSAVAGEERRKRLQTPPKGRSKRR